MNSCTPYQASELTDVLINCCTNVLTVIQTAANGEESMMSADLTCLVEKFANVEDVRLDCETGILSLVLATSEECPEERIITVDLTCIDTYVTWVDNGNGTVTFISHDGSETIGVMRDCAGIAHQPVTDPTDQIILCKSDGSTVKGSLEEVIGVGYSICALDPFIAPIVPEDIIEFGVCINGDEYKINIEILKNIFSGNMEDGHGTALTGTGTEADPYRVDLATCELDTEIYNQNAVVTTCYDGLSKNMPAIKAGDNVTIQIDGTLNVYAALPPCDMPLINYNENATVVTCSSGDELRMPAIKAGDNVDIESDGTLNASGGGLHFVNNGNPITIFNLSERSTSDLDRFYNLDVSPWVPANATGLIVRTYAECDNGGHTGDQNVPVEISIRVDNRVVNGAETGGHPIYDPTGDNGSWNDAIVPHTAPQLNMSIIKHYGDPAKTGYSAKGYLVGYFD